MRSDDHRAVLQRRESLEPGIAGDDIPHDHDGNDPPQPLPRRQAAGERHDERDQGDRDHVRAGSRHEDTDEAGHDGRGQQRRFPALFVLLLPGADEHRQRHRHRAREGVSARERRGDAIRGPADEVPALVNDVGHLVHREERLDPDEELNGAERDRREVQHCQEERESFRSSFVRRAPKQQEWQQEHVGPETDGLHKG